MKKSFYDSFHCKCGACRNTCCVGWNVTVGLEEYFRLINLDCKGHKEIKEKLDCGFILADYPTKERYAVIRKNYQGDCTFHDKDGLCMIHKYFGENAISNICKMYPRSEKLGHYKALTNSCERVIEMLMENDEPLSFSIEEKDQTNNEIDQIIETIEDRSIPLGDRIAKAFAIKNSNDYDILDLIEQFLSYYKDKQEFIDSTFRKEEDLKSKLLFTKTIYQERKNNLYKHYPNIDILIEKLLVNHLHFKNYPKNVDPRIINDKSLLIVGVYLIIKNVLYIMVDEKDDNKLIDILSSLFRIIDHSNFDLSFALFMKDQGKEIFEGQVKTF